MKQSIIFFGSGDFVIPVVERLKNYNLLLVVTGEQEGALIDFCKEKNIDFISSNLQDEKSIDKIKSLNPTVSVLASFGAIVPNEIINLFPNGIVNIHPSLLPKYKGPSPVQFAILNGETITGVTLIKLDSEIDHGPILLQKPYNLSGNENSQELLNILFEIGAEMVEELVMKLENGKTLEETPQNHENETWSYRIEKKDGVINMSSIPDIHKLDQMIRAFYPWPSVWFRTNIKGQEKLIKLLPEGKIHVEGKSPMNYKDFINGFGGEGKEILEKLNLI